MHWITVFYLSFVVCVVYDELIEGDRFKMVDVYTCIENTFSFQQDTPIIKKGVIVDVAMYHIGTTLFRIRDHRVMTHDDGVILVYDFQRGLNGLEIVFVLIGQPFGFMIA